MENKETLKEAAVINYKKLYEGEPLTQDVPIDAFIDGAKWMQERMYSEEEVLEILDHHTSYLETFIYQYIDRQDIEVNEDWFKQFKKK